MGVVAGAVVACGAKMALRRHSGRLTLRSEPSTILTAANGSRTPVAYGHGYRTSATDMTPRTCHDRFQPFLPCFAGGPCHSGATPDDAARRQLLLTQFACMWGAFFIFAPSINWLASLDEHNPVMLPTSTSTTRSCCR